VSGQANYNVADIDQARQVIGAQAGKFGSVGDAIPQHIDAGMFGTLPNSAAVANAVSDLCSTMRAEYAKAESLVDGIERTLDETTQNHAATEDANKQSFRTE